MNNQTAAVGPGCFIIGASYAGCNKTVVVALFTIGMGCMGTFYSGLKVNNLDLAPNYAGVIMAITNGVGGITVNFNFNFQSINFSLLRLKRNLSTVYCRCLNSKCKL